MFSCYKFLHFVFADETDSYFIESGTEIKFHFYLWYQLCKSGFKGIYFLDGTRKNLRLEFLDETSFQNYYPKPFLGVFGKIKTYGKEERTQQVEDLAKYDSWMIRQMKKGRQAFIIPLDVFSSFLWDREGKRLMDGLIDLSGQRTESTIILTASSQNGETLKMLTGDIFRYQDASGRPLCQKLYDILNKSEQVNLYEAMDKELDRAAVFLDVFDRTQLGQMIYAAQYRQTKEFCPEIELRAIIDYVYYWCRSRNMRESEQVLTIPKKSIRFVDLYKQVRDETTWRKLRKAAANFHISQKANRIDKLYPDLHGRTGDFYCQQVSSCKELARLTDAVDLDKYKEYGGFHEDMVKFERLKEQVHMPGNWAVSVRVEEYALRFLKELCRSMESAMGEGDTEDNADVEDTICRIGQLIEALDFSRQYLWRKPDLEESEEIKITAICELYMQYLDISKTRHRYSASRRKLKRLLDQRQEYGEMDTELEIRLEHAVEKEQIAEHAQEEARKQLAHCKNELEEHHFETIKEVLKKWEEAKDDKRQAVISTPGEKDEQDLLQKQYDQEAARRIAKILD